MDVLLWFHLVAMAFFVGGQLVLAAALVPVARQAGDLTQLRAVARRFGWGSLVAIGVLLVTGIAMASHEHLWDSGTLQLKLTLVAITGVLVSWHMSSPGNHVLEALIFVLSLAIVGCGVALAG